jgi:hypothetical protein
MMIIVLIVQIEHGTYIGMPSMYGNWGGGLALCGDIVTLISVRLERTPAVTHCREKLEC